MVNRLSNGDELRAARLARGWTQEQLGVRAKLARTWIATLEAGLPDPLLSALNDDSPEVSDERR